MVLVLYSPLAKAAWLAALLVARAESVLSLLRRGCPPTPNLAPHRSPATDSHWAATRAAQECRDRRWVTPAQY
jgi:hypothetical protein